MIKLFLVEDEAVMREGIKRRIDWSAEGIEFAGDARDGELALPMILEKKPDIVITDIKMPFMDGLKLSEHIREALPDTKIIILSGYDDFSYAKEGIRLGVTEYLLKPITPAALLKSIHEVMEKIEQERKEKEERSLRSAEEYEKKEKEAVRLFSELAKQFLDRPGSGPESHDRDTSFVNMDISKAGEVSGKELESFLRTGTQDGARAMIDSVFDSIGDQNSRSLIFLNYLTMDLYFTMVRFLKEIGENVSEINSKCGDINDIIRDMTGTEDAKRYLSEYLSAVISARDNGSARKYGRILRDAAVYIDEHYADEDISLNTLAELANISPNHFSAIFSQEMGVTFIEYLINKRMDKAKELLMTTDMKSFEIAYAVGYKDPHYFSSTFKKTQGMTTKEFRARGREG
ncbi:MAG TPA: AraC family transcriptional regulator [Lachnospiraceae bacterium]|nr:AraC family transcriptional regulator [Lachnospiraceae bacterium]